MGNITPYIVLMFLHDLILGYELLKEYRLTSQNYLTYVCTNINQSKLIKIYKIMDKNKIFNLHFTSKDKFNFFLCDLIEYLKIYLPVTNTDILQKIEDTCIFDITEDEFKKVTSTTDNILKEINKRSIYYGIR